MEPRAPGLPPKGGLPPNPSIFISPQASHQLNPAQVAYIIDTPGARFRFPILVNFETRARRRRRLGSKIAAFWQHPLGWVVCDFVFRVSFDRVTGSAKWLPGVYECSLRGEATVDMLCCRRQRPTDVMEPVSPDGPASTVSSLRITAATAAWLVANLSTHLRRLSAKHVTSPTTRRSALRWFCVHYSLNTRPLFDSQFSINTASISLGLNLQCLSQCIT